MTARQLNGPGTLTVEDRLALQDLCTRFALFVDIGDPDGVASLFTEDGSYESIRQAKTRDQIRELFATLFADRRNPHKNYRNALHICSPPTVAGDGEEAAGLMHFLFVATMSSAPPIPKGEPLVVPRSAEAGQPQIIMGGMYRDRFRKVDGTWLFARREALIDVPDVSSVPGYAPAPRD